MLNPDEFSSDGQMDRSSKEQIIDQLLSMKDKVLESLITNTPRRPRQKTYNELCRFIGLENRSLSICIVKRVVYFVQVMTYP